MKIKLVLIATVLALLSTVLVPAVALAAPPTPFYALVFPSVTSTEQTALGESGRMLAKEHLSGVIAYPTWDLLNNATVEIYATTNYIEDPTGEREGVMRGQMVITQWNADYTVAGTLELTYAARISGLGGMTFDGAWTAVQGTGVFAGISARGRFFSNPAQYTPPTLVGTWN